MADRSSSLWVAALITTMDLAIFARLIGAWLPAWPGAPWGHRSLVLTLTLWTASAAVLWIHVGFDFGVCRFERGDRLLRLAAALVDREDSGNV